MVGPERELEADLGPELALEVKLRLEPDWKHGMYKGKEVVEHFSLDVEQDKERMFGLVDNSARFELSSGEVGYGLFEYCFFGNFDRYGVA